MKFYKIWRTYSWVYSWHNFSCTFNKISVYNFVHHHIPLGYLKRFILMTSCRTETVTISRMEKFGPFDCRSHQSVASPSLCSYQGSWWTFWAFFGVFMVQYVKLMLNIFEFVVWLFDCFVYRLCSLSETFYQVWALRKWGGRQSWQTCSCLLK